jgi:hypothetical protein
VPAAALGYVGNYQFKCFVKALEDSQKAQIRKSLKVARDTHNDPTNPFLIGTLLLTLPMDSSGPEISWLTEAVARLKLPFKVEWRPLPFLRGLVTEYPEVIDYYLHDGPSDSSRPSLISEASHSCRRQRLVLPWSRVI